MIWPYSNQNILSKDVIYYIMLFTITYNLCFLDTKITS